MRSLSNVTLRELRTILQILDLTCNGVKGGHEKWCRQGLKRPIIFQTHKDPVPEFVIKNIIADLSMTRKQFLQILEAL